MWKGNAFGVAQLALFAAVAMSVLSGSVFADLFASAKPGSLRVEAHRYYVQGYQKGRSDAMAKPSLHQISPNAMSPEGDLQREYRRGYRDGYQLLMR